MAIIENIFKLIVRFLISAISTCLLPSLYLIKSRYELLGIPMWINYAVYIISPLLLSLVMLVWFKFQPKDSITYDVQRLTPVNNEYLPIYLGYIFVALSIPNPCNGEIDVISLLVVYLMICLFVTGSKSLSFNPIFIIYGYGYYKIKTRSNIEVFIISKRKFNKQAEHITFPHLRKINEFVYFEDK